MIRLMERGKLITFPKQICSLDGMVTSKEGEAFISVFVSGRAVPWYLRSSDNKLWREGHKSSITKNSMERRVR